MNKLKVTFFLLLFLNIQGYAENSRLGRGVLGFGINDSEVFEVAHNERKLQQSVNKKEGRITGKRTDSEQHSDGAQPNKAIEGNTKGALKQNRLTLEERRALRRQIHDANNDLYIPSR
ncbi:MAG: hypothetical protein Q7R66_12680 [Undibacterium sp.]|uniref:hypothetical protein n=1 Tax=Undibacterium sp. TaxID=1914977 RepID=UPI00271650A7|nr:hypothetical protein [Undibacterium sp.]MDO8653035.1 hypothetical protein [Undibacterium sp.]